ncbi:MAG: S41 family peptidase [Anaerolineales bacterium]|nr:S41 family peptidase [Anaerolineales bacterium]
MNGFVRTSLTLMLVALTGMVIFVGGFIVGHYTANPASGLDGPASDGASGGTPAELRALFAPFWEAWNFAHDEYVDQPLDDVKLMQGAIAGMLNALGDQHTSYIPPDEYMLISADQSGQFEGIGAYVEGVEGVGLRIVSPFPGSPAEAAGLLPGDMIVAVDGTDVTGLTELEAVRLVRGPAGSTVRLDIQRAGDAGASEALSFDVVRARITVASVEGKLLEGNIAYVKINDFGEHTAQELKDTLRSLLDADPAGLVLDLRGNPGGLLDTAIEVSSQFLPRGTLVMKEQFGDGRQIEYDAQGSGLATAIPLVVLINQGSASAAEIVAGAIQDQARGTLVGETSFGKGSVQNWHQLRGDNGAVRVTIARWYTPDGRSIHEQGITPDVTVPLTEDDHTAGRDPQLDAAVQQLLAAAGAQLSAAWQPAN